MSERNLWHRMDKAVGNRGHFDRREFNPIGGVPDLSYCVTAVEGHIELKFMDDVPVRDTTAVFGPRTRKGMEDDQIAWAKRRMRAGGRTYVFAQVGKFLYLFHGGIADVFNSLTLREMYDMASWYAGPLVPLEEWDEFLQHITSDFNPNARAVRSPTDGLDWVPPLDEPFSVARP